MSQEAIVTLIVLVALGVLLVRHQRSLRKFPLIACPTCHGASLRTRWIWHWASMRPRKIGGHCRDCGGKPWTERRAASGWS